MGLGGAQRCGGLGVEGNVEVDARLGARGQVGKCGWLDLGEIGEAQEWLPVGNELVEVDWFIEAADGLDGGGVIEVEGESVGKVDLGERRPAERKASRD